eukprot:766965-Hanusia_phi.AAC.3
MRRPKSDFRGESTWWAGRVGKERKRGGEVEEARKERSRHVQMPYPMLYPPSCHAQPRDKP